MDTINKIRQSEFVEKYKIRQSQIATLRNDYLTEGTDWWSEGRAIYWTPEAAQKILGAINQAIVEDPLPTDDEGQLISIRIIGLAKNPKFVYGDLNGNRISILAGKHSKRIIGKKVIVKTGDPYTYQP